MKRAIVVLYCLMMVSVCRADWQKQFDELIKTDSPEKQQQLIDSIVASGASVDQIVARIRSISFDKKSRPDDGIVINKSRCLDGKKRPWALHIPATYDFHTPTPLLVVLHGGVSRPYIMKDPHKHALEHYFTKLSEEHGWFTLFPSGEAHAEWWDSVGMGNISNLIREVKREYNIDDDRVWIAGFSDGGSGAFVQAMTDGTDFAAFVTLNCHIAVGSLAGKLYNYPGNMANRPVYAVTNDQDRLYPTAKMEPLITMALAAGADITYRKRTGGHDLSYGEFELPIIAGFLESHPRNLAPDSIIWESAEGPFGRYLWIAIDSVANDFPKPWHTDYNIEMVWQGGASTDTSLLFIRNKPSAKIIAKKEGNTIYIKESRLKTLSVFLDVDLFDFSKPLDISVNGKEVYNKSVSPDISYLLHDFLNNRDRKLLNAGQITVNLGDRF
ncbi:MAG: hypothetical protein R3F48_01935 [Candidatus Zixiibacteriota bacterium]